MFCDGCGSTLNPGMQFCNTCGKRIVPAGGPQPVQAAVPLQDRVRRNLQLLAVLWLVFGILRLLTMFWLLAFGRLILPSIFGAMGNWGGHWGWPMDNGWNWFLPFGLMSAGAFAAIFGVAYLILAWALHERRPWARTYGLVLGFLVLLRIPFGTALGIYTLWVLLPESSRREYEQLARA
jgi:hypothetical protein